MYKEKPGSQYISFQKACDEVNKMNGTDIKMNTLRWRLCQTKNGLSTARQGRPSTIPLEVEEALVTAMETSFLLSSTGMKEKPNRKKAVEDLEAFLSRGACSLKDFSTLYWCLQPHFAHSIEVNKSNTQLEERRAVWTTYNKINEWFSNLKALLIEKGFAWVPTEVEQLNQHVGELVVVYILGQLHCILNVDETG